MAGIIVQVLVAELAGVAVTAGILYAIWTGSTKKDSTITKAAA